MINDSSFYVNTNTLNHHTQENIQHEVEKYTHRSREKENEEEQKNKSKLFQQSLCFYFYGQN
jgi:hypothetical protein